MSVENNISIFKKQLGIALGVIVAIVILFTQTFQYSHIAELDPDINIELAGEEQSESNAPVVSQDAVVSAVQVTLNQVRHFIAEFKVEAAEVIEVEYEEVPDFNAYFKALFRLIISPNAP